MFVVYFTNTSQTQIIHLYTMELNTVTSITQKMRTHHHDDFTSRYHQRKTSQTTTKNHVLQRTTKTRTLLTTKSRTLTHALSSALSSSTSRQNWDIDQFQNLSTPLWLTSCLRKAWLNRSGEWPTSPERVWTASRTALGQTSVTHDEPWPETAKNITQSLVLLSHTPNVMRPRFPWGRALRLFTLDCLTYTLLGISVNGYTIPGPCGRLWKRYEKLHYYFN